MVEIFIKQKKKQKKNLIYIYVCVCARFFLKFFLLIGCEYFIVLCRYRFINPVYH